MELTYKLALTNASKRSFLENSLTKDWNLILLLFQHEKHCFNELEESQHQKPPNGRKGIDCAIWYFFSGFDFIDALPGIFKTEPFSMNFYNESNTCNHLKYIIKSYNPRQIKWLSVLHEFWPEFINKPKISHYESYHRKWSVHKEPRINQWIWKKSSLEYYQIV